MSYIPPTFVVISVLVGCLISLVMLVGCVVSLVDAIDESN